MSRKLKTFYFLIICAGWLWAGVQLAAKLPFDAIITATLTALLQQNIMRRIDETIELRKES